MNELTFLTIVVCLIAFALGLLVGYLILNNSNEPSKHFKKGIKPPINALNRLFCGDEYFTGLMICFLADAVSKYAADQERNLRKISITFNDAFTYEYDLVTHEYKFNDKGELECKQ